MLTPEMHASVEVFAARLEREQRARIGREAPRLLEFPAPAYRSSVHVGPKYTRVDFEGGRYMVVNVTGEIYGIKGYGVIHRGHAYGTLDTLGAWDWSGYTAHPWDWSGRSRRVAAVPA